jgi:two-component system OmpR family response regulator/two-component system response regulator QseB
MARILLVEDDEKVAAIVADALAAFNHVVDTVSDGRDGLDYLVHHHYELAIIDWGLPGLAGVELLEQFRARGGKTPILFLTGQTGVGSKVRAFDTGADDYICKPFAVDELLARVGALLRRPADEGDKTVRSGGLSLDLRSCIATIDGTNIQLTAGEFELLKLLMLNPGKVFSIPSILEKSSFAEGGGSEQSVRQRVMCLRKKLSVDGHQESIVNVSGQGYKFEPR